MKRFSLFLVLLLSVLLLVTLTPVKSQEDSSYEVDTVDDLYDVDAAGEDAFDVDDADNDE